MLVRVAATLLALAPLTAAAKTPVTTTKVLGNFASYGALGVVQVRKAPLHWRYRIFAPIGGKRGAKLNPVTFRFDFGSGATIDLQAPLRQTGKMLISTLRVPTDFIDVNRGSKAPKLSFLSGSWIQVAHAE